MCGIFGIFGQPDAAGACILGLHALQHRGQESAGVAVSDGERLRHHHAMGLVHAGFPPLVLASLRGSAAVGHVRYSTVGSSELRNAQPMVGDTREGRLAVVHNGQLAGHAALRAKLAGQGAVFQSDTDTEVLLHLVAASRAPTLAERVREALGQVRGAYSLLFLDAHSLVAVRDPSGLRPLSIGVVPASGERGTASPESRASVTMVASEPSPFEMLGGRLLRDVAPGEMLVVDRHGMRSVALGGAEPRHGCLFEYVYFARSDSLLDGIAVYDVRKASGRRLWDERPVPRVAELPPVVVAVPDSGLPAALALARRAGVPLEMGLSRNYYVGRTFIAPHEPARNQGVRLKLSPNASAVRGKQVILVDDSIVRGTTSRQLVRMMRDAGAAEVHLRIASPPTAWPCYYGFDTPRRSELLAASHALEELPRCLDADSVGFLSLEGLLGALADAQSSRSDGRPAQPSRPVGVEDGTGEFVGYCHACFSGHYPLPVDAPGEVPERAAPTPSGAPLEALGTLARKGLRCS